MAGAKEEKAITVFESIEFILRHPWLFVCPIIIVMSVVFAKLTYIQLIYQAQAIISFESIGEKIRNPKEQDQFEYRINQLTRKVTVGDGIREIINEVWPNIKEEKDPGTYNALRGQLRSIHIKYDTKVNLSTISFYSSDPRICYKVVMATINALRKEITRTTQRNLKAGLEFLRQQQTYYKGKIKEIDEEISSIMSELKRKSSELTDEEKILVSEITGERELTLRDKTVLQKLAKYDEILADLQLQLLEHKKRKAALEESLESGKYLSKTTLAGDYKEESIVRSYSEAIANKEFELANLLSQGYLPEHPQVRSLEKEIETLELLRTERISTLREEATDVRTSEVARRREEDIKTELEGLDLEIDTLNDKISLIVKKYQQATPQPVVEEPSSVSTLALRLKELREEKKISQGYYHETIKDLEEAELKARVEEAKAGLDIVMIERAEVPTRPIPFQKTPKVIWGLLLSVFIGTSLAYIAESLDNSIKSASELRELLHIPILASIDKMHTVQGIRLKYLRSNIVVISLIIFALSAKFLLKFRLFQLIFSFIK